ncbi:MAG: YfcE family phosphodiesterase [Chloroflexota bacterium]
MRLILIADVHANWEALLSLQRAEQKPDAVIFAGDAVGYGPDPSNCVKWLLANVTVAVRGNHDEAMVQGDVDGIPVELREAARESIAYSRKILAREDIIRLSHLPVTNQSSFGGAKFFVTHGTPTNPLSGQLNPATCSEFDLHTMFDSIDADVIVLGHTHLPAIRVFGKKIIINPGSLGQPRYGVPDATFAAWDDGRIQIHHLHYDHDAVANKIRLLPFSVETIDVLTEVLEKGMIV